MDYDNFMFSRTNRYDNIPDPKIAEITYAALGLGGETGECVDEVKKLWRNPRGDTTDLAIELGDAMYYAHRLAAAIGYTMDEILVMNVAKLEYRDKNGKDKAGERAAALEALKQ